MMEGPGSGLSWVFFETVFLSVFSKVGMELDSIAVSVFEVILVEFYKY